METIVLGGGCFWCTEAAFSLIKGVDSVVPGYAGGETKDPSYEAVCTGTTGHAEVVKLEFDTTILTLHDVLDVFWAVHNPTTLNQQGNDYGTQYRSTILYTDSSQLGTIKDSLKKVQKLWDEPVVTEVKKLETFYPAEEKHHRFFERNPEYAYCQVVINPKLQKLREKFSKKLKNS